ncbi:MULTISPECIES: DNA/RNA helicase domain-containing protein [Dysgonomonas]|uniref:Uncharacterized protein n=2 Tax=Dysgonomonas mossii TaxID=163665 RepID=F8WXN5_9BACT|nr:MULTISPECIES: DNA/RNA helicase domain-containing protein [Dysgonomonas]EGK04443.1 hypothetical protein HMPREF9456_00770 [Dysgonomonas mossii DSM 22836]OJX61034.1 MAG: hypothetical protein BGO84_16965 [Dysgonomonas sp. 37-18]
MKFTTSINIERDKESVFHYIPTSNGENVVRQIVNDFNSGIHSFNIIGSFGTGKSSLLLALQHDLNAKTNFLIKNNGQFNGYKLFEFVNIVGEYQQLKECLNSKLGLEKYNKKNFFEAFECFYQDILKEDKFLFILIDEFGKILEHAAKNNPESELYFLQEFAEYINNPKKNIVLLTTLHQSFNAYSNRLSQIQRNEWEKVKGRFKEVVFNEPIEQLLFLAASDINGADVSKLNENHIGALYEEALKAKFIDGRIFSKELATQLYPLDIFAAKTLTLAIQKYGQNERSLFSFLVSSDFKDFNTRGQLYSLPKTYDYIVNNFHSHIYETHSGSANWTAIQVALERIEAFFENEIQTVSQLIKTIGLLNIFAPKGSSFDINFLSQYAKLSLGISNARKLIERLEKTKIIRYAKYKSQYILFEGTDIDIEAELIKAGSIIPKSEDFVTKLNKHFDFNIIPAKSYQYETGAPRYFQFIISDIPYEKEPKGDIDGYINLIFSKDLNTNDVQNKSQDINSAIIYAYFNNTDAILNQIFEIDKYLYVLERVLIDREDKVAFREFEKGLQHEESLLNQIVLNDLFSNDGTVDWYFSGEKLDISNKTVFNKKISEICNIIYDATPVFKNELVNKHKVSGAISLARNNLLIALLENSGLKDLDFPDNKFPPEKSIYLSLIKNIGIHRNENEYFYLAAPIEPSFIRLWQLCESFLESAIEKKRNLKDLINLLQDKPFKLKQGLIDFWIPIFLIIKKEDYALYSNETYIPNLNKEVLDLLQRNPSDFQIRTFAVEGIRLDLFNKYREAINLKREDKIEGSSFIETIKPFLTFYNRSLNEYARNTHKLQKQSIDFRDVLANATDPEKTFFEDLPRVLGYKDIDLIDNPDYLHNFVDSLQNSIRELRTCYSELLNRIESYLLKSLGIKEKDFELYKKNIEKRYQNVKEYLLPTRQKAFYSRVMAPLKDRSAWLNSISYVIINKSLENLLDNEEEYLLERLTYSFSELSDFVDLHKNANTVDSLALKVDITTLNKGKSTKQIILPDNKKEESQELEELLKKYLSDDDNVNIYTLCQILNNKLKNE